MFDEAARIEELYGYDVLDTLPETSFDDIARLAAAICGTPISAISLIDHDRQWFKAEVGLGIRETERDVAFCAHAIEQPGVFVVPDARADPRFADNPLVLGDPSIRFYAGAPLVTPNGHALGTLCVIDRAPRELTEVQELTLRSLARQVMTELELRRNLKELAEARERLEVLAATDPLTGLANRREFRARLEVAFQRAGRTDRLVGVVAIDLDEFKQVNDGRGHEAGDDLLVAVADALRSSLRGLDTAARLGGDEFALLCEGIRSQAELDVVVRRVEAALERVSPASVGGAAASSADRPDDLLRRADAAMYAAKAERRAERHPA